jgi:hypothetical protein
MAITFSGTDLLITVTTVGTYDAEIDLYSDWKEWVHLSDNSKFPPAFDTSAGDDIGGGQSLSGYFFLRNDLGWQLKMPEADGEVIIDGNLYARDTTGIDLVVPPTGAFTVLFTRNLSAQSITTTDDAVARMEKFLRNKQVTNRTSGKIEVYDDTGVSIEYEADLWENEAGTTAYDGDAAIIRRDRLETP